MTSYHEKQDDLQPFLRHYDDSLVEEGEVQHSSKPTRLRNILPILSHIMLIGVYTLVSIILIRRASSNPFSSKNLVYCMCFDLQSLLLITSDIKSNSSSAPAQEAYNFETQVFDASGVKNKTLFGPPSEAINRSWEDLLKLANVRYSAEEVVKLETQDVIQLPDGDYFGSLWVFHQLHCLVSLLISFNILADGHLRNKYLDSYIQSITSPTIRKKKRLCWKSILVRQNSNLGVLSQILTLIPSSLSRHHSRRYYVSRRYHSANIPLGKSTGSSGREF